jgi:hypothetical protein
MKTVDGLVDLVCLEVGGLLDYRETDVPISRLYECADESGSLVQTAESPEYIVGRKTGES